jgi:opacity protein-like surface antigen
MKQLIAVLAAILPLTMFGQRLHADLYAGAATYQGDLQGERVTFENAHLAVGLGLSYDITNKLVVRGAATYMTLGGNDKTNNTAKGITFRNLNFRSRVLEAQLALEYNFFDLTERSFTPYVFAGVAAFHFQPYSFDSSDTKVFLRPLSTEGQGLPQYPGKDPYNTKQFAIPFGGGFKFSLSDRLQVGIELGLRKLFTDYLDDVSGTYADSSILAAAKGPRAIAFSYRGSELPGAPPYPAAGAIRGNSKNKDWYYTTGFRVSYLLGNGNGGGSGAGKNRLGCPTSVY